MVIRSVMSQRFIVILVLSKLVFFIHEEPIFGCVKSSFQIESVWLEFLCHNKTLCFHVRFRSLENLLSLIIFVTFISDFFINRNWSVIADISTSNWVLTGSIDSSSDFGINCTLRSSSWVWTRCAHLGSHKLRSTLDVIFSLPKNRIFLGLLLWFLLSGIHIVDVSTSGGRIMLGTESVLSLLRWIILCSSWFSGHIKDILWFLLKWICGLAHFDLFYFALNLISSCLKLNFGFKFKSVDL